ESVDVLASLDRANDGTVTASSITIARQNLETTAAGTDTTTTANTADSVTTGTVAGAGATGTLDFSGLVSTNFQAGDTIVATVNDVGGTASTDDGTTLTYTITAADIAAADFGTAVATGLAAATPSAALNETAFADNGDGTITVTNNGAAAGDTASVTIDATGQDNTGVAAGGLAELGSLSVSDASSASTALTNIETLIQSSIDAAAAFGSAEKRIEIQNEFVVNLRDSLNAGIGALRDSDLEAASARLQSLQVQQQLGIQALGIANSQPQNILSLFR
ncbi:MAG: flagellin, partial [Pseudomonadota bacterium]